MKKQAEEIHSRRRALERYGLNCGPRTRSNLIKMIQSNEAIFLESHSNRQKVFAASYEDQWYPIVYDDKRQEIVTFLPLRYLQKHQDKLPSKL